DFRLALETRPDRFPVAILLSTDGYSNSFRSETGFLQIGNDYVRMAREEGFDFLSKELPQILAEASEQGSGDEITLGILVNESALAAWTAPPPQDAEEPKPESPREANSSSISPRFVQMAFVAIGIFAGLFVAQRYTARTAPRAAGQPPAVKAVP